MPHAPATPACLTPGDDRRHSLLKHSLHNLLLLLFLFLYFYNKKIQFCVLLLIPISILCSGSMRSSSLQIRASISGLG
ncbi:hypothetical protein VNO80_03924 [Phaseolus coccineus]|uniref:Uncharacterized protein n=1 Tax=Phaseolus coccineus TaxID=3886 RepID=A0AAN9RP00_PHACN